MDVVLLGLERLHPNDYNPNQLTEAEFRELVAEVRRLGNVPKPVVVRPNAADYEIVDGEHGWKAAHEAGLTEISCEIIEADDFEAMRQTYKRNQHGTHHPVLQGRMFRRMLEMHGLSQRQLAKDMEVSEGTIRNSLEYADAADLRNSYAPERGDKDIARLSVRQMRTYAGLPPHIRDMWFDAGADPSAPSKVPDYDYGLFEHLHEAGLSWLITKSFLKSAKRAGDFLDVRNKFIRAWPDIDYYLRPAAELGYPAFYLNEVPGHQDEKGQFTPYLTPLEWSDILHDCGDRADRVGENMPLVESSIRLILHKKGVAWDDVQNPIVAEKLYHLQSAPAFLRDSELLDLDDKWTIFTADQWLMIEEVFAGEKGEWDRELLLEAQRHAVDALEAKYRAMMEVKDPETQVKLEIFGVTARGAVQGGLNQARLNRLNQRQHKLMTDREKLTNTLMERLNKAYLIREGTIDGRIAHEVLRERLALIEWPELQLLAGIVLDCFNAEAAWLQTLGGKQPKR